jgi:hypothetical protein
VVAESGQFAADAPVGTVALADRVVASESVGTALWAPTGVSAPRPSMEDRLENAETPPTLTAGGAMVAARSDDSDVLGFFALLAWSNVELDGLALIERLVAIAGDVGVVDEHVVPPVTRDEAEALLTVEELYCSLHICSIRFEQTERPARVQAYGAASTDEPVWHCCIDAASMILRRHAGNIRANQRDSS